jgi:hypothetical protein
LIFFSARMADRSCVSVPRESTLGKPEDTMTRHAARINTTESHNTNHHEAEDLFYDSQIAPWRQDFFSDARLVERRPQRHHDWDARLLESYNIFHYTSPRSEVGEITLEDLRDRLKRQATVDEPVDHFQSLQQLAVEFTPRTVEAYWVGQPQTRYMLHHNAAEQMAHQVLPPGFLNGLLRLSQLDDVGARLATLSWKRFAAEFDGDARMLRISNMRVKGKVRPVIRAALSQRYCEYSNIQMVEDVLQECKSLRNYRVVDANLHDDGLYVRLIDPNDVVDLDKPVKMIALKNSEVGRGSVAIEGGIYRLVCTNGMLRSDQAAMHRWSHLGSADRMRGRMLGALNEVLAVAAGTVQNYYSALEVEIDDLLGWMERELGVRGNQQSRIVTALNHRTTTPGNTLASVVDAITLDAQRYHRPERRREQEKLAQQALYQGLSTARDGRIRAA